MELFDLNEKQRQLDLEEYQKIKNYLLEEMKSFLKETQNFRKDLKKEKEPLLSLRDELKGNIDNSSLFLHYFLFF